jgi:hypothetical protein
MTGDLDLITIEELRAVLKPVRERYDFALVMRRLAAELGEDANRFEWLEPPQGEDPTTPQVEWGVLEAELIADLTGGSTEQIFAAPDRPRRGRPRADKERYAAVLLGVVS